MRTDIDFRLVLDGMKELIDMHGENQEKIAVFKEWICFVIEK